MEDSRLIQSDSQAELLHNVIEESLPRTPDSLIVNYRPTTRNNSSGSTWFASVFLVVNAALGAGLLNFPAAYDQCGGIIVAVTVQGILLLFVIASLLFLTYCADIHRTATYQDVVFSLCGKTAQILCSLCIALYAFGTCITFFVIIGDQWDKFFLFVSGSADFCHHWYMNRIFITTVTSVVFVLPLCFPKRIDFLKYASALGVLAVLYCMTLVIVKYFVGPIDPHIIVKTAPSSWTDVFNVIPAICFAYQCHLSAVPIYSCMAKRTVPEFTKTLLVAMALCTFAYSATASFGYLTFGTGVYPDILTSYAPTPDVLVAVLLMAVKMYTTYPILLFVGRSALDAVWTHVRGIEPNANSAWDRRRRYITIIVWFVSSLLFAVFVPNIGVVISILGTLAAVFIFTFPGLCLLQLLLQGYVDKQKRRCVFGVLFATSVIFLVVGAFLIGLTATKSIMSDVELTIGMHPRQNVPCP